MGTLFEAILDVGRVLPGRKEGTARGGSTNYLETGLSVEASGFFSKGTIFFISGANAGKSTTVTDYEQARGRFEFAAQTSPCGAGDRYLALPPRWKKEDLVSAISEALGEMGPLPMSNEVLLTVTDQSDYTLPAGIAGVRQVEIASSATAPYNYKPHYGWMELNGTLRFLFWAPTSAGMRMRLLYMGVHPAVSADTDQINDLVHSMALTWTAAERLAALKLSTNNSDASLKDFLGIATQNAAQAKHAHPIQRPQKDMQFGGW